MHLLVDSFIYGAGDREDLPPVPARFLVEGRILGPAESFRPQTLSNTRFFTVRTIIIPFQLYLLVQKMLWCGTLRDVNISIFCLLTRPSIRLLTRIFGYDMMLPMNTGAEGVETALKLAKKWGYMKKGITKDEALIVSCCGCFHGRTLAAVSMSCDNDATRGFSPLLGGNLKVDFGDADALESIFKEHGDNIAGFLFEPIQGEAGVIVPPEGYLRKVRELCSKYNVLMIADEIQTGMARTGRLLAVEWENVRPDVVILGKALGAGVLPVSAVLADKEVMLCIQPGEHGSTFGGNPLGSAVGIASLEIVQEECLAERAEELGEKLRESLRELQVRHPDVIKEVRGRGLLNAVEMHPVGSSKVTAYDVCLALKERGILAKPTHNTIIRLSPPLTITEEQIQEAVKAFGSVLEDDYSHLKDLSSKRGSVQKPEPCDRCGRVK
ncbi:ornithine--oxo-acid transaminase [Marchantia polymorpha subsp. ruderalis]|uniref:Ornithine aminotransferase n=2 Tax=Marchantia polymorpha TaxID=3197 RepID=A0AAF6BXY4_MARPO|nr:hypothetical protein MARPO_0003s0017 [Marchantia polymorpha]BBN16868.1 hypothetical protein Mp_7g09980 [Marchantia polymorpha subsp. ruderalis]|eukprot:PTQ49107.1 hypothetical protein MARPO_0003s0017 [Marchantia polymorpha]